MGATGCQAAADCASSELAALEVSRAAHTKVCIGDHAAQIPPTGMPVTAPYQKG